VIASYPANQNVTLYPEFMDNQGNFFNPVSATYALSDRTGEIATAQPVDLIGFEVAQLTVPAINNQLAAGTQLGYRQVDITAEDDTGKTHSFAMVYVLRSRDNLVPGVNSFADMPDLIVTSVDMIYLSAFHNASDDERVSALIQAWNNLGQLPVQLEDLQGTDSYDKGSTRELIDADIAQLQPKTYQRLLRAQIIEADDVLGGNPIEARRRLGLISDSAGESAHFFRTAKPLNLPCCRAAIDELRGIVNWSVNIGRA
jgi:hypothetical protein